jgi:hypothetical protein
MARRKVKGADSNSELGYCITLMAGFNRERFPSSHHAMPSFCRDAPLGRLYSGEAETGIWPYRRTAYR